MIALQGVSRSFRAWGSRARVTRPLADGEQIELAGRRLEVMHRPGHSPSDTVFWDAERRILIAADHLLPTISSNPLITRPLDGSEQRTQALVELHRLAAQDPGAAGRDRAAGPRRPDHRPRRPDRRAAPEARAAQGEDPRARPGASQDRARDRPGALGQRRGDAGVPHAVRGDRPPDLLENEGLVREALDGEVVRYEAT